MFKTIISGLISCLCIIGQGQVLNFNSMNTKKIYWPPLRTTCADSSGNIYIGGDFTLIDTIPYWGLAKWDGVKWDSLSSAMKFQAQGGSYGARTLAYYKNHIYVGGGFNRMGGKTIKYIAKWDGTNWDSLPQSPNYGVDKLVSLNGKLYALGYFSKIGSINCNSIAVWDGTTWQPFTFPFNNYGLADITEYQGELYVGGNIFNGSLPGGLVKFDGTNWSVVGQGIKGNSAWVNALKVFNNELYIGGYFQKGDGNSGENLMKWDGANYKAVFDIYDGQIFDLTKVPDGLVATGCFSSPFVSVLKISNDGICGYNDIYDNCVNGSIYANNKLYFYGPFRTVNADSSMAYICNVDFTAQTDSCIEFINRINEINYLNKISIFPNPTNSIINIIDEQNTLQNVTISIKNNFGQIVYESNFSNQINISNFSSGLYFLSITNDKVYYKTKIIKE